MMCRMASERLTDDATASYQFVSEAELPKSPNWSAESVANAVADGTLFFGMMGGRRLYPSFFADLTYKRRHLAAVSRLLKSLDGFTKWRIFVTGKGSLGGLAPLEALVQGKLRQIEIAAEVFVER